MLTAELIAPRELRLVEQEIEEPAPGEVQVRVKAVGICGSDLHSYSEGSVGDMPCKYPMVLGHEPSGTVVKTGAGVTGWSPGDRAVLEPAIYCYHCEFCRTGHHNVCPSVRFLSNAGHPGFFREFVNLPAGNLLPIPEGLSFEVATLFEPLGIALHSMKFAALQLGDTVAVFGAGPIGLLTIACLKMAGAARIWAIEPVAHRRELARQMGADVALDPGEVDVVRQIQADTGTRGVDCVIDCAAKGNSTNWGIHVARCSGRVVLSGIHSEVLVPFETSPWRRKELVIYNVRRSNHESLTAIELLARHTGLFAPVVTHTRPLERIAEAFSINTQYAEGVGKMVVV
ncbi:MAG: alcohol dehydrogenase catalytic domain-containing protein [Candidatus Solibacter sp.]|jgi:L-iditol 2-dehydrogenase